MAEFLWIHYEYLFSRLHSISMKFMTSSLCLRKFKTLQRFPEQPKDLIKRYWCSVWKSLKKYALKFLLVMMLFCLLRGFVSLLLWSFVVLLFSLPIEIAVSLLLCLSLSNKVWACLFLGQPISEIIPVHSAKTVFKKVVYAHLHSSWEECGAFRISEYS